MNHNTLQLNSTPDAQPAPCDIEWADFTELPYRQSYIKRHLFGKYEAIGAARRVSGRMQFKRSHPDIAQLVAQAAQTVHDDDLSEFTDRQRKDAQRRVDIVVKGRREIRRRMRDRRCNRTDAIAWFCNTRAAEMGLGKITERSFYRLEERYDEAGKYKVRAMIDHRGRPRAGDKSMSPEAWEYFRINYLQTSQPNMKSVYRHTRTIAEANNWDWPSYQTVRRRANTEITHPQMVYHREGPEAFRAQCVPKIKRSYSDVDAGSFWSADECTLDFFARVRDGKGIWKRVRLILSAFLDVRSRMFVGWHISAFANSDTIVAAFKKGAQDFRIPDRIQCDNGKDYRAVAGGRRRKWDYFDHTHVTGVWDRLDVKVEWATPYTPWAKIIESNFRWVHETFDKVFFPDSYCGKDTLSRPEGVMKIPLDELPTLEEVREAFAEWLDWYHDQEHQGDGINGLTPNQALAQYASRNPREKIDGAFLDHLCARPHKHKKPIVVRRDGVCFNDIMYGQGLDSLIKLQGKKVKLLIHPDHADFVDVCDLQGRFICRAYQRVLTGVTQEDVRVAKRDLNAAKRHAKDAKETHHLLLETSLRGAVKTAKARRKGPKPTPPPADSVRLVAPDLREAFESDLNPVQTPIELTAPTIDFAKINSDMDDRLEELVDDSESIDVGSALSSGGGVVQLEEIDDGDDGSTPYVGDVFDQISGSIHERKRA